MSSIEQTPPNEKTPLLQTTVRPVSIWSKSGSDEKSTDTLDYSSRASSFGSPSFTAMTFSASNTATSTFQAFTSSLHSAASTASTKAGVLLVSKVLCDEGELPQAKRFLIDLEDVPKDPLPNEKIARLTADWDKSLNLAPESFKIDYGDLKIKIWLYKKLVPHASLAPDQIKKLDDLFKHEEQSLFLQIPDWLKILMSIAHHYASKLDDHGIRFTMMAHKNREGLDEDWINAVTYFVDHSDRLLEQWKRKDNIC